MTINCKFGFGEIVNVPYLEKIKGIIISVLWTGAFVEYKVKFCTNSDFKEVWFYENELEASDERTA